METKWRWVLIVTVAPILWGTTYFVTKQFLPADSPLWGAALRAAPAAVVLVLLSRRMPRGAWWWKSAVLGIINVGAFFLLLYIAALLLPSSVAASIAAITPLFVGGMAWLIIKERPTMYFLVGSLLGATGVILIVSAGDHSARPEGVVASLGAMLLFALGAALSKKWKDDTPLLATTAWQLVAGSVVLIVAASLVEGAPPQLDVTALLAVAYMSLLATALAFVCWFAGLNHLPSGTVGIIGLLNPVTGVLTGALLANESLSLLQVGGMGLVVIGILVGQRSPGYAHKSDRRGRYERRYPQWSGNVGNRAGIHPDQSLHDW